MRILLISLLLAVPFATVASAQDAMEERIIGLGAALDVDSIGATDGLLPLVDRVFVRWQATPGVALEPSVRLGARRTGFDDTWLFDEYDQAGLGLEARFRAAHTGDVALLVLGSASGSLTHFVDDPDTPLASTENARVQAGTGLGIEVAPSRHWSVGADYRVTLLDVRRFTDMGEGARAEWNAGIVYSPSLNASFTLFY